MFQYLFSNGEFVQVIIEGKKEEKRVSEGPRKVFSNKIKRKVDMTSFKEVMERL